MKHKIYITNRQKAIAVTPETRKWVKNAVCQTLAQEGFDGSAEVSVTFVDCAQIHALNLEYREVDRSTDVLSFPMFEEDDVLDGGATPIGDIVLCLEQAQTQAEEYGHSLEREVSFLCVHSVLHLLGYDHETSEEEEKAMFARQEEILASMGITR